MKNVGKIRATLQQLTSMRMTTCHNTSIRDVNRRHKRMSRQQLKNSGKMLKKNCMNKNQVTEDQIGSIDKGKFVEDKKVMCYIACIFEMTNVVKNNKLNYDASIKQIDLMYPPDLKESAKAAVEKCKDVQKKYKDICEASYWTAKCMYDFKPEDFIFA